MDKLGLSTGKTDMSAGRSPNEWEDLSSWMISISAKNVPRKY